MALCAVPGLQTPTGITAAKATKPGARGGIAAIAARSKSAHEQTAPERSDSCGVEPGAGLPAPWQGGAFAGFPASACAEAAD
jgi:hypothetical protein